MSACILTALWALLAALGRCGVVLAALGAFLVSLGALLGPSLPLCESCATLRVISAGSTHLSSNLQQFPFTSAAEVAPLQPTTRRRRCSSADDPLSWAECIKVAPTKDANEILPNVFPSSNPADGQLDCVSDRCLRTSIEGARLLPLTAASVLPSAMLEAVTFEYRPAQLMVSLTSFQFGTY